MSEHGFKVTKHYLGLDTAWRAEFTNGNGGRVLGVNSEMDALPGIGHGCGHNLIAVSGVGVAIAVKAALIAHNVSGKVVLLGTPGNWFLKPVVRFVSAHRIYLAEEGGGGKQILLERGGYKDMDVCLMYSCHLYYMQKRSYLRALWQVSSSSRPTSFHEYGKHKRHAANRRRVLWTNVCSFQFRSEGELFNIYFIQRSCRRGSMVRYLHLNLFDHADVRNREGTNALDAAFLAYSNISVLRQQIKPDHRVHGILEGREWAPNGLPPSICFFPHH